MLYIHGPVIATILISDELDSFHFYSKGIYTDVQESDKDSEFHSVIIVGYGTDPAQHAGFRDFWRIKNTWGDDWGEDGTMRLGRNQGNLCGIATWAVVPIVIPINFRYLERGGLDPARLPGGRLLHVQPAFIEIPTGAHSTTTLNFENRSNTHWLVYRIKILEDDRREFIKISADLKVIPPQESVVIKVEVMKGVPQAHGPAYKVAEILVEYVAVKKKIIFKDGKDFAEFMNENSRDQIIIPIVTDRFRMH
ncbi:papain family cysteine protease domain-containing protein [Ditylenchus destructor]|uniref:Papain family cysteine protease domain-containing protein n=1 Tax=Ditylenchus destructor TaxID=166010 RepID=A0AAD4QV16_9BILA|nr:papain family cysteine protease domain-containing protein [Ditylenchus destructor]